MKTRSFSDAFRTLPVRRVLWLTAVTVPLAGGALVAGDIPDSEWRVLIVASNDPADRLVPQPLPGPDDAAAEPVTDGETVAYLAQDADDEVLITPAGSPVPVNGRTYEEVYRSVPYSYTEYLANPGYRHEATMEILFGQLRPTTIHKHYEPQPIVNVLPNPYQPYVYSHYDCLHYRAPAFRLLNPGYCW